MASGGGNIKVVVRVRPFNSRERDRNATCIVQMKNNQTILVPSNDSKAKSNKAALEGTKTFAFDRSYWSFDKTSPEYVGQDDLHKDLGIPLLENAFAGYNNCIFAYGQTGSGKSYSMMGYGEEEGVIPKICRDMFQRIDDAHKDPNLAVTVEVSYLEIYNERVRDLLNPTTKGNLKVREHPSTGPYVEDLAKLAVRSFAEIEHLMDEGNKARTVAATNMNETSSRSHAVFTLTLSQKRKDLDTGMMTEKAAKISLVDLAGSERATSTGATGARLKEGAEINRSLSTLGRVIAALADLSSGKTAGKKKNASMVPYRDSVLTWLLKDSLGGNSLTAMIAAISPADINFDETLSTLRYADSAKRIKNHAVVNEDANARMIRELKEELAQLRSKLTTNPGPIDGGTPVEQYPEGTPLEKQMVTITGADGTVKQVSKAEIAEQLSQSEKLYQDLNQTWEQKLEKTELIHKEREAALEELGISIEKGFVGLSTPKKMPHLVNLSDDPLLAECLIYNLKPGTTTVGNLDSATTAEIRLNGSKVLQEHCIFENIEGVVTIIPKETAAVMVNGQSVTAPKRLRSGFRVILGDFHIFRFNHPEEARAERAEQGSMLVHSMTADEIGDPNSPSLRPGHNRSHSTMSRIDASPDSGSRPDSPAPARFGGRGESDWSLARREAVSNLMGSDQKISTLTDDELNVLFEDLQKVRAGRRARPESRILDFNGDDDNDSLPSPFPTREKYLSGGTLDNFSLDTAITMPSTPRNDEDADNLQATRDDMQAQLEKQKDECRSKLRTAQDANVESEQIREERAKMEESLKAAKEEMVKQLQAQKEQYDKQIEEIRKITEDPIDRKTGLTQKQLFLTRAAARHWRQQRYVIMAAAVLQHAATLKEAQVMSRLMDKDVTFQFTIADSGHTYCSSYDLVLSDIVSSEDDPTLYESRKPCAAVRVIDYKHSVILLWSIQKLQTRVRLMRQMQQYLDRPEYMKHFRLDNPFSESCLPQYSRIGDADIPLTAVLECRVQDFTLDVYSPYTNTVIGIVHLSLEPSSAKAPSSTLKFNVVMHDFVGFAEREGTEVHAQLFFPGISEEDGATCTQMVSGFDEGTVRFDSVHSMSLPLSSPRDSSLRVSIFARVTSMHLDKILSWDDMRDGASRPKALRQNSRIPEHEYYAEERHDVFARVQLLEIGEDGTYQPVEVVQKNVLDAGTYQLRQGLQRRVVIDLTHTSGRTLPWNDVKNIRAGNLHLMDPSGHATDLNTEQADVPLAMISPPIIRNTNDNSTSIRILAHWDSSAHDTLLLDRPTVESYHVKLSLMWSMTSTRLAEPLDFSMDLAVQIRGRSYLRQSSLFSQLFNYSRVVHSSSGIFSLSVKPIPSKRSGDLWRNNTSKTYVKGEEMLQGWAPRGVSLIHDFIDTRNQKQKMAEIEAVRGAIGNESLEIDPEPIQINDDEPLTSRQESLIRKILDLWKLKPNDVGKRVLDKTNTDPPPNGVAFAVNGTSTSASSKKATTSTTALSLATSTFVHKNPDLMKSGYLLTPDPTNTKWLKRFLELRKPYLHIYTAEGDEVNVLNLRDARIDRAPKIAKLLRQEMRGGGGGGNGGGGGIGSGGGKIQHVFAVYGTTKAWIFAARDDKDKSEWIFAVDQSYFGTGINTPEEEELDDDDDDDDDW